MPQNKEYDGSFRRINVKVARPNVDIQSRQGYYAVESVGQLPILDYEAPAIAASRNWKSSSTQTTLHSSALSYPVPGQRRIDVDSWRSTACCIQVCFSTDNKNYSTDFSIVALVRDESDQIVQKLSQHYASERTDSEFRVRRKKETSFFIEKRNYRPENTRFS